MNIKRMAKLLKMNEDDTEKLLKVINSPTFSVYDMDVYTEHLDVFIHDIPFHKFLVSVYGSKKTVDLVNTTDDYTFARGIIDQLKHTDKLNDKNILKNTTATIIKHLTSIELQMVIDKNSKTEKALNNILDNPVLIEEYQTPKLKDGSKKTKLKGKSSGASLFKGIFNKAKEANSLEELPVITPVATIANDSGEFVNNNKTMNISDYMDNQQKYDYLFKPDAKESLFRHCVGANFNNINRTRITNYEFMRFDLLNLKGNDILDLLIYLDDNKSSIINDVIYSIIAGHKDPGVIIETIHMLRQTNYMDYVEKPRLVELLNGRTDNGQLDNILGMYNY